MTVASQRISTGIGYSCGLHRFRGACITVPNQKVASATRSKHHAQSLEYHHGHCNVCVRNFFSNVTAALTVVDVYHLLALVRLQEASTFPCTKPRVLQQEQQPARRS
jgi:hypothetical protein